jgi:hypothetical protein
VNRFVSFPEIIWEYAWPTSRDGAILVRRAKVLVVQSLFGRSRVVACVDSQILTVLLFWCFGVLVLREEDRIISGMIVGIVSG